MLLQPNCKINIGLRITGKRPDGYHNIDTLFYPIYGLHDELEILVSGKQGQQIDFYADGIAVDCAKEDNLVVKCYRQMAANYPSIGSVQVTLCKHIPFGAGLGGGSSDAAHIALALNQLFNLNLTREQLAQEVRILGADCPFFIYNTPCHAEGIGDILTPIDYSLAGKRIVMVKPDVAISTREAYRGVTIGGKNQWHNYFEDTLFPLHPILPRIKQWLLDAGAEYAAMSGSGSTIYGIFHSDAESCTATNLRLQDKEMATMIIFDNTL